MRVSFINSIVVLFSLFLAIGIAVGFCIDRYSDVQFSSGWVFGILTLLLVLLSLFWLRNRHRLEPSPLFGVMVCVIFFGIGFANYTLRLPSFQQHHFTNFETSISEQSFQLKIKERLKSNAYYQNYIAEVFAINQNTTNGRLLLHLKKDSTQKTMAVDDIVIVKAISKPIRGPRNPGQFNYATYMKTLGVNREITILSSEILIQEPGKMTLIGFSESIRTQLIKKLQQTSLHYNEQSIVEALILGERRHINPELYKAYAAAGAVHILAVSGLHVGIIYALLLFILKPLTYIKKGSSVRCIFIIVILWGFAILAGLSPSVVRAVTMFSCFTIATALNRQTNSFNTLFLSFFILLLIAPNWLFHVGFQLSYVAVFFILWLQPSLYKLYRPRFFIDKTLWSIITVTLAAQVSVVPLSLFYFHQFPGLFFLTNLVILPMLGILLIGGLILVFLAAFDTVPYFYVEGYQYAVMLLNNFILWVSKQDTFLITHISFSGRKLLVSYFLIVIFVLLLKYASPKKIILFLGSVGLFLGVFLWDKKAAQTNELIVFHNHLSTVIGVKERERLRILTRDTVATKKSAALNAYRIQENTADISFGELPSIFTFNNKKILIIDSFGVYPKHIKINVLLLTQSPKINLTRLIDSLQPQQIIADGSNYNTYVNRWRETCLKKKLPFHHTGTKGALTIK